MKKRIFVLFFVVLFIVLSYLGIVNAFAVSSAYSPKFPLEMAPGESKEVVLILQNLADDFDINVKANMTRGSDVASLVKGEDYFVASGVNNISVPILINIPEDAVEEYLIRINFKPSLDASDEGMVQVVVGLSQSILIEVGEGKALEEKEEEDIGDSDEFIEENILDTKKTDNVWIFFSIIFILIIFIVLVIYFLLRIRKNDLLRGY